MIKSNDRAPFKAPTVELSTTHLPLLVDNFMYETCLFTVDESEVLDRYATLGEALANHARLERKYGLKRL